MNYLDQLEVIVTNGHIIQTLSDEATVEKGLMHPAIAVAIRELAAEVERQGLEVLFPVKARP